MTWELHLEGCRSLKEKRHVLKSLKDRLHNRFNVSAAETAHHDLWQRAELTVCVVSNERGHAESEMREADRLVAGAAGALIADTSSSHMCVYSMALTGHPLTTREGPVTDRN